MNYRRYQTGNSAVILYIIAANFVIFVATLLNRDLIGFLGLRPATFLDEPWTVVTSLFVHAGPWHIIANMLTLYFLGTHLLRMVGLMTFLAIYLIGGIGGSMLFVLLGPPYSVVVGASGAVFAVGGALAVMMPNARVFIFPIPFPLPLLVAILGVFFILSFIPGVAWQAHLGGLLVGAIGGYLSLRGIRF